MSNKTQTFLLAGALVLTVGYTQDSFSHAYDENLTADNLTQERDKDGSILPRQSKVLVGHGANDEILEGNDLKRGYSHTTGDYLPRQSTVVSRSGAKDEMLNGKDITIGYSPFDGGDLPPQR